MALRIKLLHLGKKWDLYVATLGGKYPVIKFLDELPSKELNTLMGFLEILANTGARGKNIEPFKRVKGVYEIKHKSLNIRFWGCFLKGSCKKDSFLYMLPENPRNMN